MTTIDTKARKAIGRNIKLLQNLMGQTKGKETNPGDLYQQLEQIKKNLDQGLGITSLTPADLLPPYIIKMVQYASKSTPEERLTELKRTGWNVFEVKAETILIDLLTDSGTGAPSDGIWAEIMKADERYSHSATYEKFIPVAQAIFNKQFILPVHQGRAAENNVFTCLLSDFVAERKKDGKKVFCLSNSHFDTTASNAIRQGAEALNFPCSQSLDTDKYYSFKGNADIEKMELAIKEYGQENVGFILMTVVNNNMGGQPVSMENLKAAHALARKHNILFLLDSARIFENAYFIQKREEGYKNKTIQEIVHEMTNLADVVLMSAKKDAIANMGGLIATNHESLYKMFASLGTLIEGHPTYGGMSGRDLAALMLGLKEGMEQDYLRSRINQVTELGNGFRRLGFPIQWPPGSNGIYLDARRFLEHVDQLFFPAQRLCAEVYWRYGIRPVEIGLSLHGRNVEGLKVIPPMDLVRFTIPRRVLSMDHINFILYSMEELYAKRAEIGGLEYDVEGAGNGHFTSTFKPVDVAEIPGLKPKILTYFNTPRKTFSIPYMPPNAGG